MFRRTGPPLLIVPGCGGGNKTDSGAGTIEVSDTTNTSSDATPTATPTPSPIFSAGGVSLVADGVESDPRCEITNVTFSPPSGVISKQTTGLRAVVEVVGDPDFIEGWASGRGLTPFTVFLISADASDRISIDRSPNNVEFDGVNGTGILSFALNGGSINPGVFSAAPDHYTEFHLEYGAGSLGHLEFCSIIVEVDFFLIP